MKTQLTIEKQLTPQERVQYYEEAIKYVEARTETVFISNEAFLCSIANISMSEKLSTLIKWKFVDKRFDQVNWKNMPEVVDLIPCSTNVMSHIKTKGFSCYNAGFPSNDHRIAFLKECITLAKSRTNE